MVFLNYALYLLIGCVIVVPAVVIGVLVTLSGWMEIKDKRTAEALKKMKEFGEIVSGFKAKNDS